MPLPQDTSSHAESILQQAVARARSYRRLPASTYRIQFHKGFGFAEAAALVPYLAALGITHLYASPYMRARVGSTHGYDVVDHNQLNPELGTQADFDHLCTVLRDHGMGQILDTVPNHAGVGCNDNAWWNNVLEHGRSSPFASYFDITWDSSHRTELHDRLVLPILGETYAQALESGKLRLVFAGRLAVHYGDRVLPVSSATYGTLASDLLNEGVGSIRPTDPFRQQLQSICMSPDDVDRAAACRDLLCNSPEGQKLLEGLTASVNGRPGDPGSFDRLDRLLTQQHYRLCWWRLAPDEINYRRFFDINDLAGLAVENPQVFEAVHRLTLDLCSRGIVDGLRIDHPDGLRDPAAYFDRLQSAIILAHADRILDEQQLSQVEQEELRRQLQALSRDLSPARPILPVWVEKILATDEPLAPRWPVEGTSGYDFLNYTGGLFVCPDAEASLNALYRELVVAPSCRKSMHGPESRLDDFRSLVYEKKTLILERSLASELHMLAMRLDRLAQQHRSSRDFSLAALSETLKQAIACFPVYRSYITTEGEASRDDEQLIEKAIEHAVRRTRTTDHSCFDFLRDVLLLRVPQATTDQGRQACVEIAGRFQQLTAPATAKGIEDTAFYLYNRFIALNEVGGEPDRFGTTSEALHAYYTARQANWPAALSALSTHDTKRSEDVRARLYAISEIPEDWATVVRRWFELHASFRVDDGDGPAPSLNDEYLLYQTLVGIWPDLELSAGDATREFENRVQTYMLKAVREAKAYTSWTEPDERYESALRRFISRVLDRDQNRAFADSMGQFCVRLAWAGRWNSLCQTVLRLTAPGIPDTYQGSEVFDFSLVDPDNRRPVDYAARQATLANLGSDGVNLQTFLRTARTTEQANAAKLWVTSRLLQLRRKQPALFECGTYHPVEIHGHLRNHVFAFIRQYEGRMLFVALCRWPLRLGLDHGNGRGGITGTLASSPLLAGRIFESQITGKQLATTSSTQVDMVLGDLPVQIWLAD